MPPEQSKNQPGQTRTSGRDNNSLSPIRTYQSDVEELLAENRGSLAKIAMTENEKRARQFPIEEREKPGAVKTVVAASVILVVAGILAVGLLYYWKKDTGSTVVAPSGNSAIIIPDSVASIDVSGLSRDALISTLNQAASRTTYLGNVAVFALLRGTGSGNAMTAADFLTALGANAPSAVVRSLRNDFVFGIHAENINRPFLIFKTDYYQNAFAGMLAWETNGLADDVGPLFFTATPVPEATTSAAVPDQTTFEDAVLNNRDARVLKDGTGKTLLLYSFPDKNTLIITNNSDTLNAVSAKIVARQLVQ